MVPGAAEQTSLKFKQLAKPPGLLSVAIRRLAHGLRNEIIRMNMNAIR
jgi:hypothetical protein